MADQQTLICGRTERSLTRSCTRKATEKGQTHTYVVSLHGATKHPHSLVTRNIPDVRAYARIVLGEVTVQVRRRRGYQ